MLTKLCLSTALLLALAMPAMADCTPFRSAHVEIICYDPAEEAAKAERLRQEGGPHDPASIPLCRPGHMTARDGCQ
jgi:hypothetical protein